MSDDKLNQLKSHMAMQDAFGDLGDLASGLKFLQDVQSVSSALTKDCIPPRGKKPSKDNVRTYSLALMIELGEFVQELNWKPWKEDKEINKIRVADEFADILAFLGILIVYMDAFGISPTDLARAYLSKTEVNIDRFLGKVDGYKVANKDAEV